MTGRPSNQDRQEAIEFGFKTYTGATHVKCGTNIRYTKGGSCVHCARVIATEQREARKYLLSSGALDKPEEMVLEETDDAEARSQAAVDDMM
jgi:hypothetical protein